MPRRRSVSRRMQAQKYVIERTACVSRHCHTAEQWQYVPFTVDHIVPLAPGGDQIISIISLQCSLRRER